MEKFNPIYQRYIDIIDKKFSDIALDSEKLFTILGSNGEKEAIEKAGLFVFGKQIGVTSFEDACHKLKLEPNKKILTCDDEVIISTYKLSIIIKALNDGWLPDWNNPNQNKYFPHFNRTNKDFSYYVSYSNFTFTYVPSALYLKSPELVEYCSKIFFDLYEKIYN